MVITITQYRINCIGCNACVEAAPQRWRMSKKDGRSTLIGGVQKKGFYSVKVMEEEYLENMKALQNCPVNIIQIQKH